MSDAELEAAELRLRMMVRNLPKGTVLGRDVTRVLEQSQARRSGGVVGSLLLLSELRESLGTIRSANPAWFEHEADAPTAADNCKQLLELLERGLLQLQTYIEGAGGG